jgi:copper homeostasis protein
VTEGGYRLGTDLLNDRVVFELCAETAEACVAARRGGADRIEICTDIRAAGLTPGRPLIEDAIRLSGLPVHVLLRPRADNFLYSQEVFDQVAASLEVARNLGASGICIGFLNPNRTVALVPTRRLVEMAYPMAVTFHRAFDCTRDLEEALETIIETGCTRVLTSGGAPSVLDGAPMLARLVTLAAGRIEIAAGGGLTLENARAVACTSGAGHFHGSLRQCSPPSSEELARCVRTMIDVLSQAREQMVPERAARTQQAP